MGVVAGNTQTISESYSEKKVVRNSWDFKGKILEFLDLLN